MNILFVEDSAVSTRVMQHFFHNTPHEITYATDGDEALELWKKERFEIVITDLIMPKMSGQDLVKCIRELEEDSWTYIIALTSDDRIITKDYMFEVGVDDFLTKPFQFRELLQRLNAGIRLIKRTTYAMVYRNLNEIMRVSHTSYPLIHETLRRVSTLLIDEMIATKKEEYFSLSQDKKEVIKAIGICHFGYELDGTLVQNNGFTGYSIFLDYIKRYPELLYLKFAYEMSLCIGGKDIDYHYPDDNSELYCSIMSVVKDYIKYRQLHSLNHKKTIKNLLEDGTYDKEIIKILSKMGSILKEV
jgi:DNA-binding response OmpR family regulator